MSKSKVIHDYRDETHQPGERNGRKFTWDAVVDTDQNPDGHLTVYRVFEDEK
jgi:hypothetical protein